MYLLYYPRRDIYALWIALSLTYFLTLTFYRNHRRRIKTEEKAKVVSAVRGIKFIQILATLAFLHLDNFEE